MRVICEKYYILYTHIYTQFFFLPVKFFSIRKCVSQSCYLQEDIRRQIIINSTLIRHVFLHNDYIMTGVDHIVKKSRCIIIYNDNIILSYFYGRQYNNAGGSLRRQKRN